MKKLGHKKIISLASIFLFGGMLMVATSPKISWFPDKVNVIVFKGGTRSLEISFTSNTDINNPKIFIVPELKPYITIMPKSIGFIQGKKQISLKLTIFIPKGTPTGLINGTMHIKSGTKTIAKPLPISISVIDSLAAEQELEQIIISQF